MITIAATGVTRSAAVINGRVDPNGNATTVVFEYSTDLRDWTECPGSPVSASESDPVAKYTEEAPAGQGQFYRILRSAAD